MELQNSALARCVKDPQTFVNDIWGNRPEYFPEADSAHFRDLLRLQDIDELISQRGSRFPTIRIVVDGKKLPKELHCRTGRVGSVWIDDLIDGGKVYDYFADGATIVLSSLHRHWPPLGRFCREVELVLSHPVQVNVYVTPPSSQGLNVHYDTHDVFVLHLTGSKKWQVFNREIENPLAFQHRTSEFPTPGDATISEVLFPGDALYIPRGFLHVATTEEALSVHLTIGILSHTRMDVLKAVMTEAADNPAFRDALPVGFAWRTDQLELEIQRLLATFGDWFDQLDSTELAAKVAQRFQASRRAITGNHLQNLATLGRITDQSLVRRPAMTAFAIEEVGEVVHLTLADRVLSMPNRAFPPLAEIDRGNTLAVRDLARWLDQQGRLTLVRRLIREGALEVIEP